MNIALHGLSPEIVTCRLEVRLGFSQWLWSFCFIMDVSHCFGYLACCQGNLHGRIHVVHLATHVRTFLMLYFAPARTSTPASQQGCSHRNVIF